MSEVGCKYTLDMIVLPSMCDGNSRLSLTACLDIFQDVATLHAENFEFGPKGMNKRNYFWVITKIRLHIERLPEMMDRIKASTWIQEADKVSCERDFSITDEDGRLLAYGRSIWAIISHDTGRLVPQSELFPDIVCDVEPPDDRPFVKMRRKFDEDDPSVRVLGSHVVKSVDIDLGGHMNNVKYVRAMLGCLTNRQIEELNIKEIDMQFMSQCYEGETITFMGMDSERAAMEIGALNQDKKLVYAACLS